MMEKKIRMRIALTDVEQRLVTYLAKRRYENAREKGIVNAKIGSQSNEITDLDGVGAEIAGCRLFNVYPDLQFDELRD